MSKIPLDIEHWNAGADAALLNEKRETNPSGKTIDDTTASALGRVDPLINSAEKGDRDAELLLMEVVNYLLQDFYLKGIPHQFDERACQKAIAWKVARDRRDNKAQLGVGSPKSVRSQVKVLQNRPKSPANALRDRRVCDAIERALSSGDKLEYAYTAAIGRLQSRYPGQYLKLTRDTVCGIWRRRKKQKQA